ncbi:MAG TPA: 4Fe-4S binding protein [Chloroflexaceae bacterium]|nr:4Fe-4S binding protein [Chloroflexaceae bacterium]
MGRSYLERRVLRRAEGVWAWGERLLGRLISSPLNPIYHLGTLAIFLLLVMVVTGIYLLIFYRASATGAYQSIASIDAFWLGSLMRSAHRYAADGLVVTVLLHALKMLLSDRFWGSRWLSWISGWAVLALIWAIGVTGYWLVWDVRAQWITQYVVRFLGGPTALTFATAEAAAGASTFFLIVLFMHAFLPVLIIVGLLVHLMRLSRPRVWAPRWVMGLAAGALILLTLLRPATSAAPADLSRTVGTVSLDWWYLGFLPLADRFGGLFWGVAALIVGLLAALPWLARGRGVGPAVVVDEACTGCAVCVEECPYGAIELKALPEGSRYAKLAVVNPDLCTGCGLCVGACAVDAIDLPALPAATVRERLKRSLAEARAGGDAPVVVFACQGHVAMGTLPVRPLTPAAAPALTVLAAGGGRAALAIPLLNNAAPASQVIPGSWAGEAGVQPLPVLTCALPCIGMVQPEMIRDSLGGGARAVVVLTGPDHDCGFREGPQWLSERLGRRQALVRQGVHVLEAMTGDQRPLDGLLRRLAHEPAAPTEGRAPLTPGRLAGSLVGVVATLTLLFGLALVAERPATAVGADDSLLRVGLAHTAQHKAAEGSFGAQAALPEGMSVAQIDGGERHPVRLRVEVDGTLVAEREYQPGGLRREGAVYALETWPLAEGEHTVRLSLMDDGANWREVFAGELLAEGGHVYSLIYDEAARVFRLR